MMWSLSFVKRATDKGEKGRGTALLSVSRKSSHDLHADLEKHTLAICYYYLPFVIFLHWPARRRPAMDQHRRHDWSGVASGSRSTSDQIVLVHTSHLGCINLCIIAE